MNKYTNISKGSMTDIQHDERISTLETEIKHVNSSVESLAKSVSSLVSEIKTELKDIREAGRITWPLIFTAIGTLVMLATIAGTLHYQSLSPIYLLLEKSEIQTSLERNYSGQIEELRVQINANSIKEIKEELVKVRDWSLNHEKESSTVNTEQQVQIDNLIKDLDEHIAMKSHYGAMEDIVEIKSKLTEIDGNRFDSARGAILEGQVETLIKRIEIIDYNQRSKFNTFYDE